MQRVLVNLSVLLQAASQLIEMCHVLAKLRVKGSNGFVHSAGHAGVPGYGILSVKLKLRIRHPVLLAHFMPALLYLQEFS